MTTPNQPAPADLDNLLGIGHFAIGGGDTNYGQSVNDNFIGSLIAGPGVNLAGGITDIASAIASVVEFLLTLPLQVLQGIARFIPGVDMGGFVDAATAVTTIIGAIATPVLTTFDTFIKFIQAIFTALTGGGVSPEIQEMLDGIPVIGQLFSVFLDLIGLFGNPTGMGSGNPVLNALESIPILGPLFALLENLVGKIFEAFLGLIPDLGSLGGLIDSILNVLQNIPFLNILGVGGPSDIGASVQETWDQFVGGLVGAVGSGSGLSDLFNVGQQVSSKATLGQMGWDILGIRNNKSMNTGFLASSESNIGLDKLALQSSAPTFALTQSTAITAYQRISEAASKGVVAWHGFGVANITDCYINIYKMDTATGVNTLVHASPNIVGSLGTSMQQNIYSLVDGSGVAAPLQVLPSEVYGIEIAIRGTGTHSVAGQSSWLPDQSVFPRRYSSLRDSGTSAPPSTFTPSYTSNVPFVEFGVSASAIPLPHQPQSTLFDTPGSTTSTVVPSWADVIDILPLGGGGGGGGAAGPATGQGGSAGAWSPASLVVGADIADGSVISVTVGAGGIASIVGATGGEDGTATVVTYTDPVGTLHTITAAAGLGGGVGPVHNPANPNPFSTGASPGDQTAGGVVYRGGGTATWATGALPGGGGSGSLPFAVAYSGAAGAAWVVARQL